MRIAYANENDLRILHKRELYSSKRENGNVMVIGGSEDFHGAPVLSSNAAFSLLASLRAGAGYATAYVPRSVLNPVRSVSPNIIVRPLSGNNLNLDDVQMLKNRIGRSDCIVIGPGLGRRNETLKAASRIISYCVQKEKMTVIDADAIYAVAKYNKKLSTNIIVTPQSQEFSLFYRKKLDHKDIGARIKAAMEVSKRLSANILLKGHETIVTDGKRTKVIRSKSAALATMGTGDVLSGIIGGFAARTGDMFAAGTAAAYLHSKIGDELHKKIGDHILASDVVDLIPRILK